MVIPICFRESEISWIFLTFVFQITFNVGRPGSQVPRLLQVENINSNMILLNEVYAWHIGGILPHQELGEWKLLYHSAVNGLSFNTFVGNIS